MYNRSDLNKNIEQLGELAKNSRNRTELIAAIKELSGPATSVRELYMPACQSDNFFDKDILEGALMLALRAQEKAESLVLSCTEERISLVRIPVPGTFADTSKAKLASIIATEMSRNPNYVGFSLGFARSSKGDINGYRLEAFKLVDSKQTRQSLQTLAKEENAKGQATYDANIERLEGTNLPKIGWAAYAQGLEDLHRGNTHWAPRFIITSYQQVS